MNYRAWVDPRAEGVSVPQVRAYMQAHGWRIKPFPRPELLVFEQLNDRRAPVTLTLPASERADEYSMRIVDLISSLGIYEDRYAVEILNEMLASAEANGTVPHEPANTAEVAGT